MLYRYRGFPCTVTARPWYVSGSYSDRSGGGVLEWCCDKDDAEAMMAVMACYPEFVNLTVGVCDDRTPGST